MGENIQPIRLEQQQTIFRFSIRQPVRVTYKDNTVDYRPEDFECPAGFDETAEENVIFTWQDTIDFYLDPIFRGIPAEAEYLKFRFKSFEVVRSRLVEEDSGAFIPESGATIGTYKPQKLNFIFNDSYQISDVGFFTDTNGNVASIPPNLNDTPYRYEALMSPSQWYYMSEADTDLQWTLKLEISNEIVPQGVITNLVLFHAQRLSEFSYELEIEYKIRDVEIQRPIDEQQINMKNLYAMMEQFIGKPKVETKLRDGVSSKMKDKLKGQTKEQKALARRLQQEQKVKKLPPLELTPEEKEFFIEKLLSVLTINSVPESDSV